MIKNGFLQQNAFDDIDKYCSTDKEIAILDLIIQYYERALNVVKAGCPLPQVTRLAVCEEIVRIKMVIPNDQLDKIQDIRNHLDTQMGELERTYAAR